LHSERPVRCVARKKIVFVIVEGPSEDDALGVLLEQIYDKNHVFLYIAHCDITAEFYSNSSSYNIKTRVGNIVKEYAKSNHLDKKDFQEIVHIVDTDGAFIPDVNVCEDVSRNEPNYTPTKILTRNVDKIRERNKRKSQSLNKMILSEAIWGVPYQVYYMSCNLDHVLYDKQNSSDADKEKDSLAFAQKYRRDVDSFVHLICDSDFSVSGEYKETWNYIREGLHSLERHTNFGICLKKATMSQDKDN